LELLFANQDALVDYLGIPASQQQQYLPVATDAQRDMAMKQHALTRRLEERLASTPPPELQRLLLTTEPDVGGVIALELACYFAKQRDGRFMRFHGKIDTDPDWRIEGMIDRERFPFSSTGEAFSRRSRVFIVGSVVECEGQTARIRALFIGRRRWSDRPDDYISDPRRVYPNQIAHFGQVDWTRALTSAEVKAMNWMRESDVKAALSRIVGTPFVSKDWGGERSDMVTNNLVVDGMVTSAAWLLKGRSVQGTMYVADLGKRGDQIERLSSEPVDVLIVQHNNQISSPVVNIVRAFASNMEMPRRYMILDGDATGRILRDYGELKVDS